MGDIRIAGVHVRSGTLNISIIGPADNGGFRLVSIQRLRPNDALPDAVRLGDLAERFRQHLASQGVEAVGILETRAFSNWKYADAFSRVFAICAVLQASATLSIDVHTHTTNSVGKTLSLPPNRLKELGHGVVGETVNPTYWTTGMSEAAAVAIHVLRSKAK